MQTLRWMAILAFSLAATGCVQIDGDGPASGLTASHTIASQARGSLTWVSGIEFVEAGSTPVGLAEAWKVGYQDGAKATLWNWRAGQAPASAVFTEKALASPILATAGLQDSNDVASAIAADPAAEVIHRNGGFVSYFLSATSGQPAWVVVLRPLGAESHTQTFDARTGRLMADAGEPVDMKAALPTAQENALEWNSQAKLVAATAAKEVDGGYTVLGANAASPFVAVVAPDSAFGDGLAEIWAFIYTQPGGTVRVILTGPHLATLDLPGDGLQVDGDPLIGSKQAADRGPAGLRQPAIYEYYQGSEGPIWDVSSLVGDAVQGWRVNARTGEVVSCWTDAPCH